MKRTFLGKELFPFAFGGAAISGEGGGYGFGHISEQDSISLLEYAFERGVRVFDSAPIYGFGSSEERMGKALKSVRDQVTLISKSGVDWHDTKRVNMTNDPKSTDKMLRQSLKSFNTEYIDLYMIHWPDEKVDIRRPLEVLEKYKEKGIIRHIGLCNTNLGELEKAKEVTKIEVVQSEYNLFNRAVENEIFDYLDESNIDFMSWGTLDKGVLTGKYKVDRVFDDVDCRKKAPWWKKTDVEKKVQLVEETKELLPDGIRYIDLAVSFNLHAKRMKSILSGPKTKERLDEILECVQKAEENYQRFEHWEKVTTTLQKFYE